MAEVTASAVKSLREKTGAGMVDCKNALVEANGEETAAIEILRKKGMATAGKKAGRVTAEGAVGSYIHMSYCASLEMSATRFIVAATLRSRASLLARIAGSSTITITSSK